MITLMMEQARDSMQGSDKVQSKKRHMGGTWHQHLSKATKISQETLSNIEQILNKY